MFLDRRHFLKASSFFLVFAFWPFQRVMTDVPAPSSPQGEAKDSAIQTIGIHKIHSKDFNGDQIDCPRDILLNVDGYVEKNGGWPMPSLTVKTVVVGGGISGRLSDGARQFLFNPAAHDKHKKSTLSYLEVFLHSLGLTMSGVKGIRLTRWGHSIPVARMGLSASGDLDTANTVVQNRIFFSNQDNFCNPAFEAAFVAAEEAAGKLLSRV